MKQYFAIFLGEFGYELLNWHAALRKLKALTGASFAIASREGMENFYEFADEFYPISDIPSYRNSIGNGYHAISETTPSVANDVYEHLVLRHPHLKERELIYSSKQRKIEGILFGGYGGIYADLRLRWNEFRKIEPVLDCRAALEQELGFSLDDHYVLCQTATRDVVTRDPYKLPLVDLVQALARECRVVAVNFDTGRVHDSRSEIYGGSFTSVRCTSFPRQSCLIHYAKSCVFFTEGDFRSHLYVPPFLGKNVHAVASAGVYRVRGARGQNTAPIDFWNRNVFRFGGQIIPWTAEDILRDDASIRNFAVAATAAAFPASGGGGQG